MHVDISALRSVPLADRRILPQVPAVYVVTDDTGEVVYIGQSRSLRMRWKGHHRIHDLASLRGVRIAWIEQQDDDERAWIESALIDEYRPRLNGARVAYPLVNILMAPEELEALDEWRFHNRFATRAEAMRWLMTMGMRAKPTLSPEERRPVSA